jgi:hypothetical protein
MAWLEAHVGYQGEECLRWPFAWDPRIGRGRCYFRGRMWWAHRVMCVLAKGEPPTPKHEAAHECGKGHEGCVNPKHLSWKTRRENALDMRKHGTAVNSQTPRFVFTEEQVEQIKALKGKMTQVALAEKFGCSLTTIQYYHTYQERYGFRSRFDRAS